MAKATKLQPDTVRAADAAPESFATSDIAGAFAFRFSGFTMKQERPWWLTGVGRFVIDASGNLMGTYQSALMVLKGGDAEVRKGAYALQGIITINNDGSGSADILFTKKEGGGLNVRGYFSVMLAGDADHLWFISAGAEVPGTGGSAGVPAHESVTLEAVRLAP